MRDKQKMKHETYNSGFVKYGSIKPVRNKNKVKIGEDFEELGKLPYNLESIRDNDNLIADSLGYTIDKKIKVPFRKLQESIKIKIDEDIYDVVKKDTSDNIKLYLYLQKVSNRRNEDDR